MDGKKTANVLDNAFLYSRTVCGNIHHMSIFITLSETGLFFHLRVQSASLSLLTRRSRTGIITSYFFVKPQEKNRSCQRIRRKKSSVTHDEQQKDTVRDKKPINLYTWKADERWDVCC